MWIWMYSERDSKPEKPEMDWHAVKMNESLNQRK